MKIKLTYKNKDMIKENKLTPFDRMKNILNEKYSNYNFQYYSLFWLYKAEAEIIFNKIVLRRFYNTMKYGYPKKCPINKFLKEPTLF